MLALLIGALGVGCRSSRECYSDQECGDDLVCSPVGSCITFDAGVLGALEPTWYEVILPIVQQRCWGDGACHVRPLSPGLPMPLDMYADTQQFSRQGNRVYIEMANRVQDLVNPMPPRGSIQLSALQIRFITQWAEQGAKAGDPSLAPDAGTNTGMLDAGVQNTGPLSLAGPIVEVASSYVGRSGTLQGFFELSSPAWGNASNLLLMTDRANDSIFSVAAGGVISTLLSPSNEASGLASDARGDLVITHYGSREVTRVVGSSLVTLTKDFEGNRYNSPHDIVGRGDGNIYFSDPDFGLGVRPRDLAYNGIFRIPAGEGEVSVEWQGAPGAGPAGLELSLDESILYVTDRNANLLRRFDLAFDGAIQGESILSDTFSSPDGVVVDVQGNIYVATEFGVQGFAADGTKLGLLSMRSAATGVAFGGPDLRTLYITTPTALYSVAMPFPGLGR